ncbi:hypothetical protein SEMRO_1340_G264410.1 [Seminavis robusta]|uniref:Uncharacterized protein n=1 Tax=Seminavis robusta TaxID=568900 RepID=A0A9N8EK60_9STRA|nr:hypothetical protein SEMRO_1340_G264410.1 [Seminavis robusta]|eukprot:Sro1340_g264410.1 n/a (205) ;mRNA; f:23853-24540
MTYKILTEDDKIIHRAVARTARLGNEFTNWKADAQAPKLAPKPKPFVDGPPSKTIEGGIDLGETQNATVFHDAIRHDISSHLREDDILQGGTLPTIDVSGLLNRTFITNPDDNGEQARAKIVSATPTGETDADGKEAVFRFRCKHGDKCFDETKAYSKMLEWCDRDLDLDDMFKIDSVQDHRPSKTRSKFEILVEWASGTTWLV